MVKITAKDLGYDLCGDLSFESNVKFFKNPMGKHMICDHGVDKHDTDYYCDSIVWVIEENKVFEYVAMKFQSSINSKGKHNEKRTIQNTNN